MAFWNALSVLAPVAPAISDAQDIRAARQKEAQDLAQQAAQFPKEQALRDAQLTAAQLVAQGEQQRQTQANQLKFIGDPQWNPLTHSMQATALDPNTGSIVLKDVPGGVDPVKRAQAVISEREAVTKEKLSPEEQQNVYDQVLGIKPLASKITQLTGDAGKPYKGNDGSYYVNARDASGSYHFDASGAELQPTSAESKQFSGCDIYKSAGQKDSG